MIYLAQFSRWVKSTSKSLWIPIALGVTHFYLTAGFEKLDPRNIAWITFKDQRAHWVGWRFFASDKWRWPLGSIPEYGWDGSNSIINTDSWPIFALVFKLLGIKAVVEGQYFGIAWLVSSILLCIGCTKLLRLFGLTSVQTAIGVVIVATAPLFWWMHRWYEAMSGGMFLIVWSLFLYFRDAKNGDARLWQWTLLLGFALGTNVYLFAILGPLFVASLVVSHFEKGRLLRGAMSVLVAVAIPLMLWMYALGYFLISPNSVVTGQYGTYTANVLGFFDLNDASRFFPDLPSLPLQYEPTSIGLGSIVLFAVGVLMSQDFKWISVTMFAMKKHAFLTLALLVMALFAFSNVVSIGTRIFIVEIPDWTTRWFSSFQSSVRFLWPLTVALIFISILLVARYVRYATAVLLLSALLQSVDVSHEIGAVATRKDGDKSPIFFDKSLWDRVPEQYSTFAFHYAENIRTGWDECAIAAIETNRAAFCGYLSRSPDFRAINEAQDLALFTGTTNPTTVYFLSWGWIGGHEQAIRSLYDSGNYQFALFDSEAVSAQEFILLFPNCREFNDCEFLGERRVSAEGAIQHIADMAQRLAGSTG